MVTAIKKAEGTIYTQMTPRPNKKILLLDENKGKHLFPLVRDREIGISTKYQKIVIQSVALNLLSTTMMINKPRAHNFKEE